MPATARETGIRLAPWIRRRERSTLRAMVGLVSRPGILSLAGGLPAPELFPRRELGEAFSDALREEGRALQYAPPYRPLQEAIAGLMAHRGVRCSADEVLVTSGAQQAIDVLTRLLLEPRGEVLLEDVVYTGAQQAVAPFEPRIQTARVDLRDGMDIGAVGAALASGARPAFIYAVPESHNPCGVTLSLESRRRLVELARIHGVPVIEDDPYGFLSYDGPALPPLRALDPEWVFYVGSFSKTIAPALRLGWALLPERLIEKATIAKEAGDLETSGLVARAVARYLAARSFPEHLERLRSAYRRRRDAMLDALERWMPRDARWSRPRGGMFVWVELPEVDTARLLEDAVREEGVAFVPGHAFSVTGRGARDCLRLSFATATPEEIEEGVRRLAGVIEKRGMP